MQLKKTLLCGCWSCDGQGASEQAEVLEELPAVERFSGEKSGMASRTSLGSESITGNCTISTQLHDMFQYV